jgi:hypothetical protein
MKDERRRRGFWTPAKKKLKKEISIEARQAKTEDTCRREK